MRKRFFRIPSVAIGKRQSRNESRELKEQEMKSEAGRMITLNHALCDWITISGVESRELWQKWDNFIEAATRDGELEIGVADERRLQYHGQRYDGRNGSAWAGMADITGYSWVLFQVSGELANEALAHLLPATKLPRTRATRIDLQITIEEPPEWEQIRFFNRMKRAGKRPGYIESKGARVRTLATVYVGQRSSQRIARIYEKETAGGGVLLRFEGEYKGDKAAAVAEALAKHTPAEMILSHIQSLHDEKLSLAFEPPLSGIVPHNARPAARAESKTEAWLTTQVMAAFRRVINTHSGGGRWVAESFMEALKDAGYCK